MSRKNSCECCHFVPTNLYPQCHIQGRAVGQECQIHHEPTLFLLLQNTGKEQTNTLAPSLKLRYEAKKHYFSGIKVDRTTKWNLQMEASAHFQANLYFYLWIPFSSFRSNLFFTFGSPLTLFTPLVLIPSFLPQTGYIHGYIQTFGL